MFHNIESGIRIFRYDLGDPQAGKDVCDHRIGTLKSHMRRFINEGNDINTANDMKVAIESYGGVKGCYATVAEIQDSFQSMTKHSMTGIQALNNFLFESAGLRAWKAYNVGTGRFFSLAQIRSMVLHKVPQVSKNFSHLANRYKMSARFVQEQRRPKMSDHQRQRRCK